ncbi:MAG: response regulator [Pseudomonadota bacterium]
MRIFMLVDDAPIIRKVATRIISDMDFAVVEAESGVEALEKCEVAMPDAIMIDWRLPDMTGLEFLEQFRNIPGSDETKVFYCTSEIMVPEMTKARRNGSDAFVMKPFNRDILEHKLKEVGFEALSSASNDALSSGMQSV